MEDGMTKRINSKDRKLLPLTGASGNGTSFSSRFSFAA
jgi:hypothetical protein